MKKIYLLMILFAFTSTSWSQEYRQMIAKGTYTVHEIQTEAEIYFDEVGRERGKGYKPYKRWEYQALRNVDENGMLKSPEFYFNELEDYNNFLNQNFNDFSRTTVGTWEELGPTSWNATSGWNPGVGRITSISVDPANINHIIVGGETGGVWRTVDGGTSWNVLTDNLSNLVVYSLTIDPTNSSTYFWGSNGGIIFKSIDSGDTWNFHADTGSGNVNKILIDPTNTQKMYCSVEGGGIFKSTNAGVNWDLINPGATNGYDVEFKPGDTNIIYASGNQFYKSTDGGATFALPNSLPNWEQEYVSGTLNWSIATSNQNNSVTPKTGIGMAFFYIGNNTLPETKLISPSLDLSSATNPELKFSYTQVDWSGDQDELKIFYKTSSAGAWVELANYTSEVTSWSDITLSLPNPSSDYYLAFQGKANYGRGVTLDDISVEDITLGVVFSDGFESATGSSFSTGAKMIGVSTNDPETVYVLEASGGVFGAFYKSTDSGNSFTELNHVGKNYFGYSSTANDSNGQAPRDMDVAVNPNNANDVHIAGVLSWRSTDGGAIFNITSQWTPGGANAENIGYCHADIDLLEFVGNKLYVGSDGGIFVADDPLSVSNNYYRDLTNGLGIRQFYKIGISQTDPVVVTGGSQDNGTSVMDVNGNWIDWIGADGMEGFVDKNNNNIIYGSIYNGNLYKSVNGGVTLSNITSPQNDGNWITPFEQDPIVQNVIYTGYDEVYKSINGGGTWTSVSQNFGGNLNHLKVAPSNSNYMYASIGGSLYRNTFVGIITNWTQLSGFSGSINSIAIHPTNPNKVAIATTGNQKVYVSINGGNTWTSYRFDLPNFSAQALAWHDNGDDGLYLGMNYGVYYIDNTTNNSWQPFSNNLPNVIISELEINTVDNRIYAATYGRGLWRSDLFNTLGVNDFELDNISLYPNSAKKEVFISWNKGDEVAIRVYNSEGKLLYFGKNKSLLDPYKIDVSNYASGLYFVKVNNINGEITKKLIVE